MVNGESIENNLRTEYEQTWQDYRHRTTVEMTILSVYFATVTGLLYTFAQHGNRIGPFVGAIGIMLSIGVLALLLGERRPWSADLVRLNKLESLLSGEEIYGKQLERVRLYHGLWTEKGYSLSLAGSFTWYLLIVMGSGALFGWIFGLGLAEVFCPRCSTLIAVLCSIVVALILAAIVRYIMWRTRKVSLVEAQAERRRVERH